MHRGLASCVVGLVLLTAVIAPAASAGTPETAEGLPQEFDPDTVALAANLQANGDAEWTFTYRMRLETDNETQAFESLQADIKNNRSAYVDRFRKRIVSTVNAAENATNREMAVSNVSVSTRVNSFNEYSLGVVTYSFDWEGFAATEGDTIKAGDALEGFYLDNETSLLVSWPDGYQLDSAEPPTEQPRANAVKWTGPLDFGQGQPSVVVSPAPDQTTTAATTTDQADEGGGVLFRMLIGALVALVVLGGGGYLYWRREHGGPTPAGTAESDDGGPAGGAGASAAAGGEAEEPPEELLSNEERVKRFLQDQGGRAKQQALVDEMGWTEAKTSQVVKEMRENDELESFRIGRENVLKLPDAEDIEE